MAQGGFPLDQILGIYSGGNPDKLDALMRELGANDPTQQNAVNVGGPGTPGLGFGQKPGAEPTKAPATDWGGVGGGLIPGIMGQKSRKDMARNPISPSGSTTPFPSEASPPPPQATNTYPDPGIKIPEAQPNMNYRGLRDAPKPRPEVPSTPGTPWQRYGDKDSPGLVFVPGKGWTPEGELTPEENSALIQSIGRR